MFGIPIVSVTRFGLSFLVQLGEMEAVELPVFVLPLRVLTV